MSGMSGSIAAAFKRGAAGVVTAGALDVVVDALVAVLVSEQKRADKLEQRVADLEQATAELRAQPKGLQFTGTWQQHRVYAKDEGTTYQGALGICTRPTATRPGLPNSGWTLAAKGDRSPRNGDHAP